MINWISRYRMPIIRLLILPSIALIYLMHQPWFSHSHPMHLVLSLTGTIFVLIGVAIRLWATLYIGGRKTSELITSGPYSLCRNPLYVGSFFSFTGFLFILQTNTVLGLWAILLMIHFVTIRNEERLLQNIFGETYTKYRNKIPRLFPQFKTYQSPEQLEVNVRAVNRGASNAIILLLPLLILCF